MALMVRILIFCSDVEDVVCIVGEGGLILRREAGLPGFRAIAVSLGNKIKPRTYGAFYSVCEEYNRNQYWCYYLSFWTSLLLQFQQVEEELYGEDPLMI